MDIQIHEEHTLITPKKSAAKPYFTGGGSSLFGTIRMLKNGKPFGKDYFDELLERIREIRVSERRAYQKRLRYLFL